MIFTTARLKSMARRIFSLSSGCFLRAEKSSVFAEPRSLSVRASLAREPEVPGETDRVVQAVQRAQHPVARQLVGEARLKGELFAADRGEDLELEAINLLGRRARARARVRCRQADQSDAGQGGEAKW
jgi:hypothetical protein